MGGATPTNINVATNSTSRNGANYNFHDTLTWLKGQHNFSMGGTYTNVWEWSASHPLVNTYSLGLDTANDPAAGLFTAANFPGSTTTDLASARNLYAMLTGRVTQITGNAILQPDGTYLYRADTRFQVNQPEFGSFIQDQWRLRPNVTVNAGVRYELQYPIRPTQALFSRNDVSDLCGQRGHGRGGQQRADRDDRLPVRRAGHSAERPGADLQAVHGELAGVQPRQEQLRARRSASPGSRTSSSGFLRAILGDPNLATVRASWARSFNQGGLSDYLAATGPIQNGPGLTVNANRNVVNNNLVPDGDRAVPLLLSQTNRLGGPATCPAGQNNGCIPTGVTFPIPIVFSTGVSAFDPNYQTRTPTRGASASSVRSSKDMSVEVRYMGNKDNAIATTENYNEIDIYNSGFGSSSNFIDEFKKAQHNLAANVAAGKGATFAYTGVPGTRRCRFSWRATTAKARPRRAIRPPTRARSGRTRRRSPRCRCWPRASARSPRRTRRMACSATRRSGLTASAAGLPANFWVMNPDSVGGQPPDR